jgi:hypothetical protein
LDFAEFAVMWAPYLDPGSPHGADQEADSPGTAASFAREPLATSAGKAPKPISRGKSGKGVRINGVPSQRDVTKPALQREQSSMSSRLSVLVSTSFAKKVKQTKQTFSFRRRANHDALFGPRKSADQAGGAAATAKNAPPGSSTSVLGMAGALDSQPRASAPAAAAVADPFLSALEHAEQRDLDTQRRLGGTSAQTKLEATTIYTTSSSEEAEAPAAVASGSRGPTSTRSHGNLAGRGGSRLASSGRSNLHRVASKAVVLS